MFGMGSQAGLAIRREAAQVVNEIAQGLRTLEDGTDWFSALSPTGRQVALQEVTGYAMQAHITAEERPRGSCPVRREAHC